ncbi:MAG: IS630 transposase-related protein [Limnothrix sp.]
MPAAYHIDLRRKVIQAIENGMQIREASRVFGVSRNSIYTLVQTKRSNKFIKSGNGISQSPQSSNQRFTGI